MPRSVVVSVGISWEWPGTRTCGISVGPAGGFRRLAQSAVQGLLALARGTDPRFGPSGWLGCPTRLISKVRGRDSASRVPSVPLAHPGGGRIAAKSAVLCVGHDAVVGAAGAGAAGAGAVTAEHLRGGPAVEFHQVSLGAAAV